MGNAFKEHIKKPEMVTYYTTYHKEHDKIYNQLPEVKKRNREYNKAYKQNPKNKLKRNAKLREKNANDSLFRITTNMSSNFYQQLKNLNTKKPRGTMTYIGCTKEELLEHLDSGEYTLEDYMLNTPDETLFNLDHIIPSDYFKKKLIVDENGKISEETLPWLYKWWNYRNLRVWPAIPNMSKGDNMDYELFEQHGIEDLLTLD